MKPILPDNYRGRTDADLTARIRELKQSLGPRLVILTHHYQRQEIVDLGDFGGDSFGLAKIAAAQDAEFIVFCGVHFMAESAAVLARPGQSVFIPDAAAGCPMADMAPADAVENAWAELGRVVNPAEFTPITYVNSTAAVKSFCGNHGGACCTSSNARKVFEWACKNRPRIFFMPDEHLGRNTAADIAAGPVALWDPDKPNGGIALDFLRAARVLLWKGHCHVHTSFTVEQVTRRRAEHPGCLVVVHPECRREVVEAADASGSTEQIIKYVDAAPAGAAVVIGTEIHLVERMAKKWLGKKTIVPLARSLCPNMYRINLHHLCWTLDGIAAGPGHWVNRVEVPAAVRDGARLALSRMLEIAG